MACGKCGARRSARSRPVTGLRSVQAQRAASGLPAGNPGGANPTTIRALGMQSAVSPTEVRKMDEQRRRIERLRREAVLKKFNK